MADHGYETHKRARRPALLPTFDMNSDHTVFAQCPDCGLSYYDGRWQAPQSKGAEHSLRCPACSRIHDHVPAGLLQVGGRFFLQHRDEILAFILNKEYTERQDHPLERIMGVEAAEDGVTVSFTGVHLARGTEIALYQTYQGDLEIAYDDRDAPVHVYWYRS
ncbi:MAG: hypothetical protein GC138_02280 [Gammaproteobacteria bacterium]|nr:hypothetical protein [Gammaproteobacteria bacterium]